MPLIPPISFISTSLSETIVGPILLQPCSQEKWQELFIILGWKIQTSRKHTRHVLLWFRKLAKTWPCLQPRSIRNPKRKFDAIQNGTGKTGQTFQAFCGFLRAHKPTYIYCEMVPCKHFINILVSLLEITWTDIDIFFRNRDIDID